MQLCALLSLVRSNSRAASRRSIDLCAVMSRGHDMPAGNGQSAMACTGAIVLGVAMRHILPAVEDSPARRVSGPMSHTSPQELPAALDASAHVHALVAAGGCVNSQRTDALAPHEHSRSSVGVLSSMSPPHLPSRPFAPSLPSSLSSRIAASMQHSLPPAEQRSTDGMQDAFAPPALPAAPHSASERAASDKLEMCRRILTCDVKQGDDSVWDRVLPPPTEASASRRDPSLSAHARGASSHTASRLHSYNSNSSSGAVDPLASESSDYASGSEADDNMSHMDADSDDESSRSSALGAAPELSEKDQRILAAAHEIVRSSALTSRTLLTHCSDFPQPHSFNVVPVRHCIFSESRDARFAARVHSGIVRQSFVQPDVMLRAVKDIKAGEPIIFLCDKRAAASSASSSVSSNDSAVDHVDISSSQRLELQCSCHFDVCQYHAVCNCGQSADSSSAGEASSSDCPWPACMHVPSKPVVPPFIANRVLAEESQPDAQQLSAKDLHTAITPAAAGQQMALSDFI